MERLLPKIKETVDSVYEYLTPHPDGIGMVAKEFGKTGGRICTSLVNRGIIEKTNLGRGAYKYKWIATMAPTTTLYRSIAMEIQAERKSGYENHKKKSSPAKIEEAPIVVNELVEDKPVEKGPVEQILEMWEKMKKMGVSIENNQLVLTEVKVTKTVLS